MDLEQAETFIAAATVDHFEEVQRAALELLEMIRICQAGFDVPLSFPRSLSVSSLASSA